MRRTGQRWRRRGRPAARAVSICRSRRPRRWRAFRRSRPEKVISSRMVRSSPRETTVSAPARPLPPPPSDPPCASFFSCRPVAPLPLWPPARPSWSSAIRSAGYGIRREAAWPALAEAVWEKRLIITSSMPAFPAKPPPADAFPPGGGGSPAPAGRGGARLGANDGLRGNASADEGQSRRHDRRRQAAGATELSWWDIAMEFQAAFRISPGTAGSPGRLPCSPGLPKTPTLPGRHAPSHRPERGKILDNVWPGLVPC